MLTLTKVLPDNFEVKPIDLTVYLTAEERTRSRYIINHEDKQILLKLPRGTVLKQGDLLTTEKEEILVEIASKPEPVFTVTALDSLTLLRTAYHLGNRHVPLEITANYLRLAPDPVLKSMLEHLGVNLLEEILPFHPDTGAYSHSH
jgi:urease accessory protein